MSAPSHATCCDRRGDGEADRPAHEAIRLGARASVVRGLARSGDQLGMRGPGVVIVGCVQDDAEWEARAPCSVGAVPSSSGAVLGADAEREHVGGSSSASISSPGLDAPAQHLARMLVDLLEDPLRRRWFDDHVAAALEAWPGDPIDLSVALGLERRRRGLERHAWKEIASHSKNAFIDEEFERR